MPPVDAADDVAVVVVAVALVGLDPGAAVVVVVVVVASPPGEAAVVEEGGVSVVLAPGCTGIPCMPARLGKRNITSPLNHQFCLFYITVWSGFCQVAQEQVCLCVYACVCVRAHVHECVMSVRECTHLFYSVGE